MFCSMNILAQNSFGLNGLWSHSNKSTSLLNSLDNNPSSYFLLKDWGLTFSYGGEFSNPASSNLYLISLSKRIGAQTFSARYTPGYQKEFLFSSGTSIVLDDSSFQSLNSKFIYKEVLGFGYSFSFSEKLIAGFSLRYFKQEFNNENFKPILLDTLYYLERENLIEEANFWKGDLGLIYNFNDKLSFSLSSINLFNFGEQTIGEENAFYKIRTEKSAAFGISFSPFKKTSLNFLYETNNAFQLGVNRCVEFNGSEIGIGATVLHDKLQSPFINGMTFGLSYSNNIFGVALSGIKYFRDRNQSYSFSEFKEEGINNLMNNKYSFDKAILSLSFTLNTLRERLVEFSAVEIIKDIYPTFQEAYIDSPFALGRAVNLSDKPVSVKPSSKIEGINNYFVQSHPITIPPKDTAVIPFYTIITDGYTKQKTEITQAYFSLITDGEEPDDKFQAPVLLNGINSWDGKVKNLSYFIKKDLDYSMSFSKNVLSQNKNYLDSVSYMLSPFYKAQIVFNDFVKQLVYTSDPRASTEYVQFPNETIKLRGGDCDDLSVCYSSLLESIGIETALIDYKNTNDIRHVNVLLNTNLKPDYAELITSNDTKYFLRKDENGEDEVWIPIETTSLTDFSTAWEIGAERFFNDAIQNYGLVTGKVEIIDVY